MEMKCLIKMLKFLRCQFTISQLSTVRWMRHTSPLAVNCLHTLKCTPIHDYCTDVRLTKYEATPCSLSKRVGLFTNATGIRKASGYNFKDIIKKKLGMGKYSKANIYMTSHILYSKIDEQVNIKKFFTVCKLPDTLASWSLVIGLHIWILMVRLRDEGDIGIGLRDRIIMAFYEDMDIRIGKLEEMAPSIKREAVQQLAQTFLSTLAAYDEGILSNDMVLASALWRYLFGMNCDDPEYIEACVKYVRQQVAEFDKLSTEDIFTHRKVDFIPFQSVEEFRKQSIA